MVYIFSLLVKRTPLKKTNYRPDCEYIYTVSFFGIHFLGSYCFFKSPPVYDVDEFLFQTVFYAQQRKAFKILHFAKVFSFDIRYWIRNSQ